MKLETWQRDRNERCMERHQLSIERLQMIDQEETVQDRKKKSDRQDREKVLVCMRFFHCLFLYC